jgi:hypothetical protein
MKSDLEILKDIFRSRDIAFKELDNNGFPLVRVEEGYHGFYSDFEFDENGILTTIGAYE